MSIFTTRKNPLHKFQIEKQVIELFGENYTRSEVIEMLTGDIPEVNMMIVDINDRYCKTTKLQRFNMIWVFPVWLSVGWIKWILTGSYGVDKNSKAGEILTKLIGNY